MQPLRGMGAGVSDIEDMTTDPEVGSLVHPGGNFRTSTWEETRHDVGRDVPQTGREPEENREQNRHKVAPPAQLLPTIDNEQALETERQRQLKALKEITHATA